MANYVCHTMLIGILCKVEFLIFIHYTRSISGENFTDFHNAIYLFINYNTITNYPRIIW